ncbi:hypothetical protein [Shewanella halifaxensis]|uniref:hypothetical protein n=1 Tax=Shewanella halifaxensis TaxID=271098 RepID=UPI000D58D146|nr:hypothetical protein [Shewanella halifaxensis]
MFDLSKLTKRELLQLNSKVIERLKEVESQQTARNMDDFTIGDKVSFTPPGEEKVVGIVIKKNKKTISVLDELSYKWNIPPTYLTRLGSDNVIEVDWVTIKK